MSIYLSDPQEPARACVIWMHGLGADASDMAGLAQELRVAQPLRHVFLEAPVRPVTLNGGMPMRAWYDITGLELQHRADKAGINESQQTIMDVISAQIADGFQPEHIFLAGFSQGGAMAIHTAVHYPGRLAGVIALSAYLPLGTESDALLNRDTPWFLALGVHDPLVKPEWSRLSMIWLKSQGFGRVSMHEYPMEHSVCRDEIQDLSRWLDSQLEGAL